MINQLKIAFRFLRNNGTFTALNIIGLAFGFTCAILIMMHVGKEESYNTSIPEHERVFYLAQKSPESPLGNTTISYALSPLLSESFPEIEYNGQPLFNLNKNTDYKAFNQKLKNFYSETEPEKIRDPERLTLALIPSAERKIFYNRNPLYLLIFIGIIVLAVSILTYVNLSTSLVQKRTSEMAMRKISGAGKWLIGLQFFRETAIISFLAVILGAILAKTGWPVFKSLTGSDVKFYLDSHLGLFIGELAELACCEKESGGGFEV